MLLRYLNKLLILLVSVVFIASFTFAQKSDAHAKLKDVETVYPQSVDYWTGTTDGTTYTQTSLVEAYGATSGGYMIFDISAIPDQAVINSVVFNGYVNLTNYPYWSVTPCYLDPLTTSAADLRVHIGTFSLEPQTYLNHTSKNN